MEAANAFLREQYLVEFNSKFAAPAREKSTAFRKTARADLNWIFTVQSERVVAKDNTVAIGEQCWQLEKSRFRNSLAGCTVTIHQHLDGTVSVRYARMPWAASRHNRRAVEKTGPWRRGKNKSRFPPASTAPWKSRRRFSTAPATITLARSGKKTRKPASASRRGTKGAVS